TDSPDFIRPMVEIEQLSTVLTPAEIIAALTRNAAAFLNLDAEIGTLETGKVADLVMVDGNPLGNVQALGHVQIVVRGGRIAIDNRQAGDSPIH
ncbi:MAG TPA: amidohydrolase family protein, partial [Woeseiaceae bacterium]|nr:amidohydrolase family protein [Woeseiaceae bacterium]